MLDYLGIFSLVGFFIIITMSLNQYFRSTRSWLKVREDCFLGGKGLKLKHRDFSEDAMKFLQLKFQGTYYSSLEYARAAKTVNYVAMINLNGRLCVAKINYFIFDGEEVLYSGNEVKLKDDWTILAEWKSSRLMRVDTLKK